MEYLLAIGGLIFLLIKGIWHGENEYEVNVTHNIIGGVEWIE